MHPPAEKCIDFKAQTLIGNVVLLEQPSGRVDLGIKSDFGESLDIVYALLNVF